MQLTAVPSLSKCFFTGIATLSSLFQKEDGGPSSELIIVRKNKLQPYFPVSLIYKGFSIAICLLVFHWPGKVCHAQRGGKKELIILHYSLVLLSHSFSHTPLRNVLNLHATEIAFATYFLPLRGCSSIWSER